MALWMSDIRRVAAMANFMNERPLTPSARSEADERLPPLMTALAT